MDLTEWMRGHSWALAPAFIVVLAAIVWMRTRLAGKIEIKPVDVGIALTPFVLWMATAGIFKKVEVPGIISFETADAIVSAAAAPIDLQVSKMPVTALTMDAKRGVSEIPKLIHSGIQVLSFRLNYGGYYGPAIWMYFNYLISSPSFKYVVITEKNGSLFGLYEARELLAVLNPENNGELLKRFPLQPFHGTPREADVRKMTDFAKALIRADEGSLRSYPGVVPVSLAVKPDADKKRVLEQMEKRGLDWLPVVKLQNGVYEFQGIVERSRLTASLILDVATQLQAKREEKGEK